MCTKQENVAKQILSKLQIFRIKNLKEVNTTSDFMSLENMQEDISGIVLRFRIWRAKSLKRRKVGYKMSETGT